MQFMFISNLAYFLVLIFFLPPLSLICGERESLTLSTPSLPSTSSTSTPITPRRPLVPNLRLSNITLSSPRNTPRIITPTPGLTLEQRVAILELNLKELESKQSLRADKSLHSNQFAPHALAGNDHYPEHSPFKPSDFNKSSNDHVWEMVIKEIIKINQPLTAASLTLLFYIISNKELMASLISFFNENIKDKFKELTQQAAWSNLCNSFMPYLSKRSKSLNGWAYMGLYAAVDLASSYLKHLAKKPHKSTSPTRKKISSLNRLHYIPWLIKTGFTQLIAQSFL